MFAGVEEPPEKVFLSSATLLVVPSNLVQHWVHQVKTHVRQGKLRLLIISSDKERSDKMPAPHSLAWNYDLVSSSDCLTKSCPHRKSDALCCSLDAYLYHQILNSSWTDS